jgi:hypothetical protein
MGDRGARVTIVRFCEAVVNDPDAKTTILALRICGRRASEKVLDAARRECWVCDEHKADFAPRPGQRIGVLP